MISFHSFTSQEILGLKFGYSLIGKPKMHAHLYYVDGLLIDTGQRKARKQILSATKGLQVEQILITHHHEDHSGNVDSLKKQHNCEAFASERCCQIMQAPPKISFAQHITWGDRPAHPDLIPIQGSLETKQFTFELIPIPGHASDMIALFEPNRQWLFSADLYIHSFIAYFMKEESMREQIDSIKRILQLDFKEMFCSHNPQLVQGKEQLTKKLHFLESFFEKVAQEYQKGYTAKEVFKSLNLKENTTLKFLSGGNLSQINMVKSVIRDVEYSKA